MAWQDRIKTASYTSPSGETFTFQYENVSRQSDKKTSEFIFTEIDGSYIQDLGRAGRRYPFIIYFSGDNYDQDADKFFTALEEKGVGKLDHPRYGSFPVVPTGTIAQRDDLITEANQAVFNITFSETIENITFPSSESNAQASIAAAADTFSDNAATDFADSIDTINNGDKINLQTMMQKQLSTISKIIKTPLKSMQSLYSTFKTISTSFENTIDDVFDNTEGVARQGISIIRIPAKLEKKASEKIQIYTDMFNELGDDFLSATSSLNNMFRETNKNLMSCVAAANESMLYTDFSSMQEAIEASESLLDLYDSLLAFQDIQIDQLEIIDTGLGYDSLAKLVGIVAGYLISLSFNLPKQKILTLGENRNIIELCAELYQDLTKLDFLIITNDLTADEIELLPIGKEIIYYE